MKDKSLNPDENLNDQKKGFREKGSSQKGF